MTVHYSLVAQWNVHQRLSALHRRTSNSQHSGGLDTALPGVGCYDHEAFERFHFNTILHGDFNSKQYSQTLKHGDFSELGEEEDKIIYVAQASCSFYTSFYLVKFKYILWNIIIAVFFAWKKKLAQVTSLTNYICKISVKSFPSISKFHLINSTYSLQPLKSQPSPIYHLKTYLLPNLDFNF